MRSNGNNMVEIRWPRVGRWGRETLDGLQRH